jgi:hypothetical protein
VIEFLYRIGKTSSITGEKLTEQHVLHAAMQASAATDHRPAEYLCYPCTGSLPHYALMIDSGCEHQPIHSNVQDDMQWMEAFDLALGEANSEYQDKRGSGRLGPMVLYRVADNALSENRLSRKSALVSDEQVKSEVLSSKLNAHSGIASATLIPSPHEHR